MDDFSAIQRLIAYYGSLLLIGLIVGMLGPALTILADQTHSTLAGVSLLLAVRPMGYMASVLFSGWLLDRRIPGHTMLAIATLGAGLLLAITPTRTTLLQLAGVFLALGVTMGVMDVGSATLLSWSYAERLAPYLSGLHFSFGLGAFLSPLLLSTSLDYGLGGWGAFTFLALLAIPLALWQFAAPNPTHRPENCNQTFPIDWYLVAGFAGFFFLYGGAEAGFGAWIYQYALAFNTLDSHSASWLTALFWGLLGGGRLGGIALLARFTPRSVLWIFLPLAWICLTVLLIAPDLPYMLWMGCAGAGLFMACIFPSMLAHAARVLTVDGRLSGRVGSAFFLGSSSGAMVLPWLMGQAFSFWGPRWIMVIISGAILIAFMVFILFLARND